MGSFYDSPEWRALRATIIARDGSTCTVAWLLGGACSGPLHVHHIVPVDEAPHRRLDPDNCGTTCAAHHPTWEAARLFVERSRRPLPKCKHGHRYREGQIECDRRRARKLGIVYEESLDAVAA